MILFILFSFQNDVTLRRGLKIHFCHEVITQTNHYDKQAVIV